MAFLGGLFGDIKTSDVLVGAAKRGAEILRDEREEANETVSRMADYQIKKNFEEQERYQTELRENIETIKGIAGRAGGLDVAEYLVREHGIQGAIEQSARYENLISLGVSPTFITNEGTQNTAQELASYVTANPTVFKASPRKQGGILGAIGLGRDLGAEAQGQTDAAVEAMGYGRYTKPDLGIAPTMSDTFDKQSLYSLPNLAEEAQRLMLLSTNLAEGGDPEGAKKQADKARLLVEQYKYINNTGSGLTEARTTQNQKIIGQQLATLAGTFDQLVPLGAGEYQVKTKLTNSEDINKHNMAINKLVVVKDQAIAAGMSAAQAEEQLYDIFKNNLTPQYVTVDGVPTIVAFKNEDGSTEQLVPGGFSSGVNKFAPPKITNNGNDNTVINKDTIPDVDLKSKIDKINKTANITDNARLITQLSLEIGADKVQQLMDDGIIRER